MDSQCASGHCYTVTVAGQTQGVCSQCKVDADCTGGGCSPPDPLSMPIMPAMCNMGQQGGGCMSTAVCMQGLYCGVVVSNAMLNVRLETCGQCATDTDCTGGQLCTPDYNIATVSGYNACVAPMTVQPNQGCPFMNNVGNDSVCAPINGKPGHCTQVQASAFGMSIPLGFAACGQCASNNDCTPPQTCQPAQAMLNGFRPTGVTGSICQ